MIKDKEGFLLAEETIKIIIALICLVFLIYLLVSVYYSNKNSKDLKLAQASMDYFISEVDAGKTEVEIFNPEGWYFLSWPHPVSEFTLLPPFYKIVVEIPKSCLNLGLNNCFCICSDNSAGDCDSNGYCVMQDYRADNGAIKISNPPITLEFNGGAIRQK